MFGSNWKCLTVGVVLLGAAITGPGEANAQGWPGLLRPAYWWSAPYYATCCDPCCLDSGEWYLGVRPGPVRRLLFGTYRWYYDDCCSTCEWEACCCEETSSASPSDKPTEAPVRPMPGPATTYRPTPKSEAPQQPETPPAGTPNSPNKTGASVDATPSDVGQLTVRVPADADVFINGLKTASRGTLRAYLSQGLKPGRAYDYEVRVQVRRNGTLLEEVREVRLTTGAQAALAIDFDAHPAAEIASLK